jgi:hypothetical protein
MAHIKFVSPSGWEFDRQIVVPVKIGSRGLIGNDRRDFLKTASHSFLPQIDNYKFASDEIPVHLIALGASEAYGPNRNGDAFKEATCKKYHDTFVKFAKFFRNHKNKPERGDPFYGHVKASAYNDDMRRVELLCALNATKAAADRNGGLVADTEVEKIARGEDFPVSMACVLDPTYPVLTRDQGYLSIAEIKTGMYVWTHKGRWRRVTGTNRRRYTGKAYTFKCNGLPLPLELTADHPMLAKTFACAASSVKGKARRYFKDTKAFDAEPAAWTHAEHLQKGDRFFYQPVTRFNGYAALSCPTLAAILGYYLAEGSFSYNGEKACSTEFTCNLTDSLPRRLPRLVEILYPDITVSIEPKKNSNAALAVIVRSTEFSEFLRQYVGRGCKNKRIPPEIFNAATEIKLAFLGAWLDGDGWTDAKGGHFSSANVHLVLQGRDLLASVGIPTSIYRIDHALCENSGYENSGIEYTLNVSHLDLWQLASGSQKAASYTLTRKQLREKPAAMRICPDQRYAYRIADIESRDVTDVETYNFEVEEDESYSLGGFVSHNCRVPNDICSFCKHAARTRDEYCTSEKCAAGGCKNNLTRLVKVAGDLHHLHVDNPDPTWFDISRVFRPADRIAYGAKADYFTKAASDSGVFELQDYIKLASTSTAPLDVILYQSGQHGFWSEKTASQIRLGYALASMEGAANVPDSLLVGILTKPFPVEKLAAFGSAACDSQLAAMADRCIFLSLADYSRLTKTEEHLKTAQAVLPAIYSKMASDETLPLRIERSPSALIDKIATANANLLAASFSEDFSFSKESVYKRSLLGCCRNYQTPKICHYEKLAECNTEGEALAKDYAMYKLAALWRSAACNPNFPLTARLAVCQNQLFSV